MSKDNMESLEFYYIQHTPKAILVSEYSQEERNKDYDIAVKILWLPLSQVEFDDPDLDVDSLVRDDTFYAMIPTWLAKQKNLI